MEIRTADYRKNNEMMMTTRPSLDIAQPVKRTVLYFSAFILAGMLFSWLFTMEIDLGLPGFLKKLLFIIAFLVAGIIQVSIFPRVYSQHEGGKTKGLLYPLLLALLLWITSFLVFMLTDFDRTQYALLAACSFLLPLAIQQAWIYFDFVATPEPYKSWVMQAEIPLQNRVAALVNDLPLKLRLKINYYDTHETSFRVMVPARLTLGKMFHGFLIEQETKSASIQLLDKEQQPFAWRFVLQRTFSSTNLDPDLTLAGNEIKPKDIIFAERVGIS